MFSCYNSQAFEYRNALCCGGGPQPFRPQGGEKMNKYELMFIVEPSLDDAKKEEVVEAVKAIIAEAGEVLDTDVWGMRKLAYPIQKKTEGYYVVMHFNGKPELPKELDRRLRISDNFMRHIIINLDEE